jgi:hypothetical protein
MELELLKVLLWLTRGGRTFMAGCIVLIAVTANLGKVSENHGEVCFSFT